MRKLLQIAVAGLIALSGGAAHAVTIDFDALTVGSNISGVDLGGVIITSGTDVVEVDDTNLSGFLNQIRTEPFTSPNPFRADFTAPVSTVSVDLGDFNADSDNLFLQAYDAMDNLLASDTFVIPGTFTGLQRLNVAAADIAYVLFANSGGSFPNSVFADNLTFDTAAVPLPAALPLFGAGLGVMGLLGWRRKRKIAAAA